MPSLALSPPFLARPGPCQLRVYTLGRWRDRGGATQWAFHQWRISWPDETAFEKDLFLTEDQKLVRTLRIRYGLAVGTLIENIKAHSRCGYHTVRLVLNSTDNAAKRWIGRSHLLVPEWPGPQRRQPELGVPSRTSAIVQVQSRNMQTSGERRPGGSLAVQYPLRQRWAVVYNWLSCKSKEF